MGPYIQVGGWVGDHGSVQTSTIAQDRQVEGLGKRPWVIQTNRVGEWVGRVRVMVKDKPQTHGSLKRNNLKKDHWSVGTRISFLRDQWFAQTSLRAAGPQEKSQESKLKGDRGARERPPAGTSLCINNVLYVVLRLARGRGGGLFLFFFVCQNKPKIMTAIPGQSNQLFKKLLGSSVPFIDVLTQEARFLHERFRRERKSDTHNCGGIEGRIEAKIASDIVGGLLYLRGKGI